MLASEQVKFNPAGKLFAGELALDGEVRGILGALSIAISVRDKGFKEFFPARRKSGGGIFGFRNHALRRAHA